MTSDTRRQDFADAAARLWRSWEAGEVIETLEQGRPASMEDGYAIQAALAEACGQAVAGWKIAATSAAGQAHIAVDGPIAGRLLAGRCHPHPARLPFGHNRMAVAEAEFAFRFGEDLPARDADHTHEEILARVAALHPAIELPDSRFHDFAAAGGAQLAADNACAHLFVLGPEAGADWRGADLRTQEVILRINGEVVSRGHGSDALGDPLAALAWLVNCPAVKAAGGLRAGQVVTTGVCGLPSPVRAGDRVEADFGPFGSARVELGA